jgi:hypothetical protein
VRNAATILTDPLRSYLVYLDSITDMNRPIRDHSTPEPERIRALPYVGWATMPTHNEVWATQDAGGFHEPAYVRGTRTEYQQCYLDELYDRVDQDYQSLVDH